ncbi:MAG: phosphotriesterase [Clostridiales bacterium]|nr:phosphotriesterase [Clostridiales bacterium]
MPYVQTVTGKIKPEDILFCHCHEHLMLAKGKSFEVNPALLIDDREKSLRELMDFRACGGSTIVEAQPVGCGRMAQALAFLSETSGVSIIASTGFHKMIFYPENHWIFSWDEEQLYRLFLCELQSGMYADCDASEPKKRTDIQAGIIKCALDTCGFTHQYEKLFRAASRAAIESGAPMMVHIEQGADPVALAGYLAQQGVEMKKVIFCHMDRACPNLAVHHEIANRGIFLEYDTIGRFKYHDDETEAAIFLDLIQGGYEDQLLFSLDTTRQRLKSYTPQGVGLSYIIETFIPLLREHGVSDDVIRKISRDNCRRVLAIS